MFNSPENLRIEIGNIWLSPIAQGTHAAKEVCYLLLNHVFKLGYRRVDWVLYKENIRSYKLAIKVGFSFEFIEKNADIAQGRGYDYAWFRVLDFEWPEKKKNLKELLYT